MAATFKQNESMHEPFIQNASTEEENVSIQGEQDTNNDISVEMNNNYYTSNVTSPLPTTIPPDGSVNVNFVDDQPNTLIPNNDKRCIMDKCIRKATKQCGKCQAKICDIHVGAFSKQYTVLCKVCYDKKVSKEDDEYDKCSNKCKRFFCCSKLCCCLCYLLFIMFIYWTQSWARRHMAEDE